MGCPLGQTVQVDGALKVAPRRSQIPLGGKQEVHRIACLVNRAVLECP